MKCTKLEVVWQDATALVGPWDDLAAVRKSRAVRVHSVGYVLADDKRVLIIARSIHGKRVGGVAIIPQRAIVSRKRLR